MRVNTRLKYGLRTLMEIAAREEGRPGVKQKTVALHQGISEKYLDHIIADLKKAGLLENAAGKSSGYRLTRPPDEITMDQIFRAFGLLRCTVDCIENPGSCDQVDTCTAKSFWKALDGRIEQFLKSVSLDDIIKNSV